MRYLLDIVYLGVLLLLSPWLLYKALTTGKYRRGLAAKLFGLVPAIPRERPVAWFHGVSVGEIHLLRQVIAAFRSRHPDWRVVVSTTTDTGLEEARKHFADLAAFHWPFDFSWAVRRGLRQVQPALVVLAEGEMWPNFLQAAAGQGVPVAVINGRMSPRSARRYEWLRRLVRPMLERVSLFAMQTEEYAAQMGQLGAHPGRIRVTGSVKYDGVTGDRGQPRTRELARLFGIQAGDLVWVAGSTQAPEEEIVLDIFRRVRVSQPNLRLLLVPRQRDRFEDVAGIVARSGLTHARRSQLTGPADPATAVILVDTIGELAAVWGLADVAFVGGSLEGQRGGQNMIEPAAYGAAVVFGPHVWNFRDTVARLLEADAALQVADAAELEATVVRLLEDKDQRTRLGQAARDLVRQQQGATARTMDLLDELLDIAMMDKQAA